ncbi:MAG: hypothetical protein LBQ36_05205 [Synergistaceae bacterium]|jgi:hypothetical protein|nr:hypothetical protein [Synergistaceae bacterium]
MRPVFHKILTAIRGRFASRSHGKLLSALSLCLLLLTISVFIRSLRVERRSAPYAALLEALPDVGAGSPAIVMSAIRGEFPQDVARLLADSTAVSPGGASGVTLFLPIFDTAEAMSMVITERAAGLVMYGAFTLTLEENDALRSGELPEEWKRHFVMPELLRTHRKGLFQLRANNVGLPIYLGVEDEAVFVADSILDADRIMEVRDGIAPGMKRKWPEDEGWGGHVYLSDGGVLHAMMSGGDEFPTPERALEIEISWKTSDDLRETRAKWRINGAEHILGRAFSGALRGHDWSRDDLFIPDPLVLSLGVNMPNPGRNAQSLPSAFRYLAEYLRKMGLKASEVQALMTGQAAISLGGRTQLLWFDLPGIVLDLPGRGETSFKLVDKFWTELFAGTEPSPIDGYSKGGVTNLPFTVIAAADEDKAVIGLIAPDVDQNLEVKELLAGATSAAAWIYVDFPRLGASLAEVPALGAMIYEDEESPIDEESANNLKDAMKSLGRVFVICESASSGSAMCYY